MQDRPAAADLLDIVAEVLRDAVVPALDGATAYHARIAASLVALVAREIRLGPAAAAAGGERLRALLGMEEGGLATLNRTLADRLRDGTLALDDPAVADHLRRTVRDKLAIDNPRFPRLHDAP